MRKVAILLLGVISLWPLLYLLVFFGLAVQLVFVPRAVLSDPQTFNDLAKVHIATIMVSIVLTLLYMVHALRNGTLPSDQKTLWILSVLFFGIAAIPIYWYRFIWHEKQETAHSASS